MPVADVPTNYLARVEVQDGGHIDELTLVRYIGKVTGPDIIGFNRKVVSNEVRQLAICQTRSFGVDWFLAPATVGLNAIQLHDSQGTFLVNAEVNG